MGITGFDKIDTLSVSPLLSGSKRARLTRFPNSGGICPEAQRKGIFFSQ